MKNQITLKSIFDLLLENKKLLIIGQIITFFAILISIPIPLLLPVMVDEVLLNKPDTIIHSIDSIFGNGNAFYYISLVTILVIFLRIIHFIATVIITKIFTKISKYVTFEIRKTLLTHLKKVSMNEYESLGSGSISSKLVTDINTLDNFIISIASKFVSSFFTLIAVAIVIITIDPILGIAILIIQPLIMLISKKISKKTGVLKKNENKAIADFQDNITETLDLFSQIKASNKEELFFNQAIENAREIKIKSNAYSYKSVAYERFSFTIFLVVFELFRASGLILVEYQTLSIGMMFAMFGYIWFIITPVQDLLSIQYSWASAKAAINRINKILLLKTEHSGNEILCQDSNELNILIKNLNFSYNKEQDTLKNISMEINSRDKIAFIGASGSGKTTLAQIIGGFYEKNNGDIYYNNIHIDNINHHSLREKVFLVLQMPILFNNTLRFNICMSKANIDDESIFNALKIAQLYDLVIDMELGLDTVVGKHGIRLSGGQRQRLSIARMIIANPSLVIFDESTSALDVNTEINLFEALADILKDKTVITIAHRLSTVKNANMIYVLNDGEIVQRGTHDNLKNQNGHYESFIKNQLI
jgi:ATP-binding cassette subfamily C protein